MANKKSLHRALLPLVIFSLSVVSISLIISLRSWGVLSCGVIFLIITSHQKARLKLPSLHDMLVWLSAFTIILSVVALMVFFLGFDKHSNEIVRVVNQFLVAPSAFDSAFAAIDASSNGNYALFEDTVQFKNEKQKNLLTLRTDTIQSKYPFAKSIYAFISLIYISVCVVFFTLCSLSIRLEAAPNKQNSSKIGYILPFVIASIVFASLAGDSGSFGTQVEVILYDSNFPFSRLIYFIAAKFAILYLVVAILLPSKSSH